MVLPPVEIPDRYPQAGALKDPITGGAVGGCFVYWEGYQGDNENIFDNAADCWDASQEVDAPVCVRFVYDADTPPVLPDRVFDGGMKTIHEWYPLPSERGPFYVPVSFGANTVIRDAFPVFPRSWAPDVAQLQLLADALGPNESFYAFTKPNSDPSDVLIGKVASVYGAANFGGAGGRCLIRVQNEGTTSTGSLEVDGGFLMLNNAIRSNGRLDLFLGETSGFTQPNAVINDNMGAGVPMRIRYKYGPTAATAGFFDPVVDWTGWNGTISVV